VGKKKSTGSPTGNVRGGGIGVMGLGEERKEQGGGGGEERKKAQKEEGTRGKRVWSGRGFPESNNRTHALLGQKKKENDSRHRIPSRAKRKKKQNQTDVHGEPGIGLPRKGSLGRADDKKKASRPKRKARPLKTSGR